MSVMAGDFDGARQQRHSHIAIVTLDRRRVFSAVSHALGAYLEQADREPEVRAIVLTGAGSAFCAGADLREVAAASVSDPEHPEWGFAGVTRDATFVPPEVTRELIGGAGGLIRVPRQTPIRLAFTGDPIDAATAHAWGLVNRVVDAGDALVAAIQLAERIAANAPVAVTQSKPVIHATVHGGSEWPEHDAWEHSGGASRRSSRPRTPRRDRGPSERSGRRSGGGL
jgi:crotonobetainyl-CoA hydratase